MIGALEDSKSAHKAYRTVSGRHVAPKKVAEQLQRSSDLQPPTYTRPSDTHHPKFRLQPL